MATSNYTSLKTASRLSNRAGRDARLGNPAVDGGFCTQCHAELPGGNRGLSSAASLCIDCAEALEAGGRLSRDSGTWWY